MCFSVALLSRASGIAAGYIASASEVLLAGSLAIASQMVAHMSAVMRRRVS
jgi:hypothetical protein